MNSIRLGLLGDDPTLTLFSPEQISTLDPWHAWTRPFHLITLYRDQHVLPGAGGPGAAYAIPAGEVRRRRGSNPWPVA
jgi:hypothetical protein